MGGVADDFTGATDLAGNWLGTGLRTTVVIGVPGGADQEDLTDVDAVVVALKSRSSPVAQAVEDSVAAAKFLLSAGCEQIYQKYCSTFDSTAEGNIGPVADALLSVVDAEQAVVVPSFPVNGRTVYQGHLFVGAVRLDESPMRDHPLNPMRDSSVIRLLGSQTQNRVGLVPLQVVQEGPVFVRRALDRCAADGERLVVVDAVGNGDLAVVAEATETDRLVTGASGLALGAQRRTRTTAQVGAVPGRRVILSGSASVTTRRQVEYARKQLPHQRLDLASLRLNPRAEVDRLVAWVEREWSGEPDLPVMVYSVGDAADLERGRGIGGALSAEIEWALASLATELSDVGASQMIVAGGETSGAVLEALGVRRLDVGHLISPGVSWLAGATPSGRQHNFILKSGNFGADDLFLSAWGHLA